jgi:hypothetical protein
VFLEEVAHDPARAECIAVEPLVTDSFDHPCDRQAALLFLCERLATHQIGHTSRFFIDHLLRTSFLLEDWGCPRDASLCGLFHSVYGTKKFEHSTLTWDQRWELQDVIGVSAEALVYRFCTSSSDACLAHLLHLYRENEGELPPPGSGGAPVGAGRYKTVAKATVRAGFELNSPEAGSLDEVGAPPRIRRHGAGWPGRDLARLCGPPLVTGGRDHGFGDQSHSCDRPGPSRCLNMAWCAWC